jgi:hypothetical protein
MGGEIVIGSRRFIDSNFYKIINTIFRKSMHLHMFEIQRRYVGTDRVTDKIKWVPTCMYVPGYVAMAMVTEKTQWELYGFILVRTYNGQLMDFSNYSRINHF